MAKTHFKSPYSKVTGFFGNVDASRGRDPGISADLFSRQGSEIYRAPRRHVVPTGPYVHIRTQIYCDCDCGWKSLGRSKRGHLPYWYTWTRGRIKAPLPSYQLYMQMCLRQEPEIALYSSYCWAGRYKFVNDTRNVIPAQTITLTDIPSGSPTGADCEVWSRLSNGHLGDRVPHLVISPGIITIDIGYTLSHTYQSWDVYAYNVI